MFERFTVGLLTVCCVTICAGASLSAAEAKPATPVVAVFELPRKITDRPPVEDPLLGNIGAESLRSLLGRIRKAKDDDGVVAGILLLGESEPTLAQIEELRQGLEEFAARKPLYGHADSVHFKNYVLLTGATRASTVPTGDLWVNGLALQEVYVRGLLDWLQVQPDFLTCGKYKSAAEMFMLKESSPEAREMHNWLLDGLFDSSVAMISRSRKVSEEQVKAWIEQGIFTAESAKAAGLIDAVESREQLLAYVKSQHGSTLKLNKKYAKKSVDEIDLENPFAVLQLWAKLLSDSRPSKSTKNAIAVVHIDGPIMLGKPEASLFGSNEAAYSEEIRKALDQVADEPRIRGVVLRVNSPGGSATASEVMLQAVQNVQSLKPVVVSMGGAAASGGYYVSSRSEYLFADATTITGSIGVVGGKLATEAMWTRVGINFDEIQRGKRATLMTTDKPWSADEKADIQKWMDEIYGVFKQHVVDGRKDKLKKPIDDIAGGRVYTGKQALELGLVDELGTLSDAIHYVAKKQGLEDYEIRSFPEQKNFLEQLMADLGDSKSDDKRLSVGLLSQVAPVLKQLDPARMQMVEAALRQLDCLQTDGVMLTVPVLQVTDH